MAALNHQRSGSRSRFSTGLEGGNVGEQRMLPVGSCNFRDLSIGARAPTCGCTRFWLNVNNFNNHDGHSFCFCGHHACFHDAFSRNQQPQSTTEAVAVHGASATPGIAGDTKTNDDHRQSHQASTPEPNPTGLGIRPGTADQPPSINVRVWEALNAFARDQEHEPGSGNTSKLPSTAAPSVVEETRYTPPRAFQERSQQYRLMGPPVDIPHGYTNAVTGCEEYSATEVATPSITGTPDFRALAVPHSLTRQSPSNIRPQYLAATGVRQGAVRQSVEVPTQPLQTHPAPAQPPSTAAELTPDIHHLLHSYNRRIETLESLSFSQRPIEEVQERLELFDGRLLDLEQWRGDHEHRMKQHSMASPPPIGASSSKRRRLLPTESCSFESGVSFDLNAAAHTEAAVMATLVANAESLPRIEALESRIADLEDLSLPTFARPWQIEVVLLPWGRDLRGIWFSSEESTHHSLGNSTQASAEEWTGASSVPKLSFKSSTSAAWTTESIQAWADEAMDWLSPKACGPSGTVFQRLASRGLVRDITLTSSDSRHVLHTLSSSFSNILTSQAADKQAAGSSFQGLDEPFIPLRKVRKSSRLRFLSPAEMVTSSAWTAEFLGSSVCMKVNDGQQRLYITTSQGYQQQAEFAWSWPQIRQLPLFDATGEEQAAQATHAAIEAVWSYNDRLDRSTSTHTSFAESQWSIRSQSGHGEARDEVVLSSSPRQIYKRQRTVSLPSSMSVGDQGPVTISKRRVASFETNATHLLHPEPTAKVSIAKRRRVSISPEAERRGVALTPRYSREPPSPFTTSDPAYEARSQATSSRKRGITPLAYATPHSNNNFASRVSGSLAGGDGDTEPDVEFLPAHQHESDKFEDEWNGVDDDMQASADGADDDAKFGDEDDLDEDERLDI